MKKGLHLVGWSVLLLFAFACGGPAPTSTPILLQTLEPAPSATRTPTPSTEVEPTPVPTSTPTTIPTATDVSSLELQVVGLSDGEAFLSEEDVVEVTVGSPGFAVVGFTNPSAVVSVDGRLTPVDELGMFVAFITLVEGPNFVDLVVSDLLGNQRSVLLVVHSIPPTVGIPLHVAWPPDEFDVEVGRVSVIGTSRPDAVVSVNGVAVAVNAESAFRYEIPLEEGPNLIEVTASDLLGNSETVQRVVTWVK